MADVAHLPNGAPEEDAMRQVSAKGEPVRLLVFACQVCWGRTPTGHGDVVFAPGQLVAACNRCGTAHQLTAEPMR